MDIKLFITGVVFIIIGFVMFYIVRNEEPASEENNWTGSLPEVHTRMKLFLIFSILFGLAFIIKSL